MKRVAEARRAIVGVGAGLILRSQAFGFPLSVETGPEEIALRGMLGRSHEVEPAALLIGADNLRHIVVPASDETNGLAVPGHQIHMVPAVPLADPGEALAVVEPGEVVYQIHPGAV